MPMSLIPPATSTMMSKLATSPSPDPSSTQSSCQTPTSSTTTSSAQSTKPRRRSFLFTLFKLFQNESSLVDFCSSQDVSDLMRSTPALKAEAGVRMEPKTTTTTSIVKPSKTNEMDQISKVFESWCGVASWDYGVIKHQSERDACDFPRFFQKDENVEHIKERLCKCVKLSEPQPFERIIHQIWVGPREPPCMWIDTWRVDFIGRKGSDWAYNMWSNDTIAPVIEGAINRDIIEKELRENGYRKWQLLADLLRLEILYRYGGCYVDADSICLLVGQNTGLLDSVIEKNKDKEFIVAHEKHAARAMIGNSLMVAKKNSAFVLYLLHMIRKAYQRFRNGTVEPYIITGPFLYSVACKQFPEAVSVIDTHTFYPMFHHNVNPFQNYQETVKNAVMVQFGYTLNGLENLFEVCNTCALPEKCYYHSLMSNRQKLETKQQNLAKIKAAIEKNGTNNFGPEMILQNNVNSVVDHVQNVLTFLLRSKGIGYIIPRHLLAVSPAGRDVHQAFHNGNMLCELKLHRDEIGIRCYEGGSNILHSLRWNHDGMGTFAFRLVDIQLFNQSVKPADVNVDWMNIDLIRMF